MPEENRVDPPVKSDLAGPMGDSTMENIFAEALESLHRRQERSVWEPPSLAEAARLLPGYEIIALRGRGGMGAVYEARQKSLDRIVALKLLPAEVAQDGEFVERFIREARTLARLNHSHIVTVYDFGRSLEEHLYFTMELVEGTDLARMLDGPKLAPELVCDLILQVCQALHYAHEQGIVHRDVKPANVLVSTTGRVKVADFGLARQQEPGAADSISGPIMGTPAYMSPEQLAGRKIDRRVDVYALGVMLYQMLCGKVPGIGSPAPSQCAPVDARWDAVVFRALQAAPDDRYQTADEMRLAVEQISQAVEIAPWYRRRPLLFAAAAALLAVAASDAVYRWTKARQITFASGHVAPKHDALGPDAPKAGERPATPAAQPPLAEVTMANATRERPYINWLGMRFVPVPITGRPAGAAPVLFSIWETRVQDYQIFVQETQRTWPGPGFAQGPTDPAVMVSRNDAQDFCEWLTARERKSGHLSATQSYRLPSDHEWSCAVGLGELENAMATPAEKDGKITNRFPWGSQWPPPAGTENLGGEELRAEAERQAQSGKQTYSHYIAGYSDAFVHTAPVGSFPANAFGLFDLGGNVREWCGDWYDSDPLFCTSRGGSWIENSPSLSSSARRMALPATHRTESIGFRVVLGETPAATAPPVAMEAPWRDWVTEYRQRLARKDSYQDDGRQLTLRRPSYENMGMARDSAVRATWIPAGEPGAMLMLRRGPAPPAPPLRYYGAKIGGQKVRVFAMPNAESHMPERLIGEWPLPPSFDPKVEQTFEFRALGNRYTVRLNGQEIGSALDTNLDQTWGWPGFIAGTGTVIRKLEYQLLDRDINKPPDALPDRLPSSQWQALGLEAEPGHVLGRADGWKRCVHPATLEGPTLENGAVRGRFRFFPEERLWLLLRSDGQTAGYAATIAADGRRVSVGRASTSHPLPGEEIARFDLPRRLSAGDEFTLEFRTIGDRLAVYFDGELIGAKEDRAWHAGRSAIYSEGGLFRDLAWGEFAPPPAGVPPPPPSSFYAGTLVGLGTAIIPSAANQLGAVMEGRDTAGGSWRYEAGSWAGGQSGSVSAVPLELSPPVALRGRYRVELDFTLPGATPLRDVILLVPLGGGRSAALRVSSMNFHRILQFAKSIEPADSPVSKSLTGVIRQHYKMTVEVHLQGETLSIPTSFSCLPDGAQNGFRGTVDELALPATELAALGNAQAWLAQNRAVVVSYWPIICHTFRLELVEGGSMEKLHP